MTGRQEALGVAGEHGRRAEGFRQAAGLVSGDQRAAAEQQRRAFGRSQTFAGGGDGGRVRRGGRGHRGAALFHAVHRQVEHVDGDLDVHRARAAGVDDRQAALQHRGQVVGPQQGVAERGHVADQRALVGDLVQAPLAEPQLVALVDAGDHHHRHRIAVGLPHRGRDVGHAGAGDDEAGGGTARRAREAIGHEARSLLVARGDVTDPGSGEPTIQLDGVHAGDAEDMVDAVRFQQLDEGDATGGHGRGSPSVGGASLTPGGRRRQALRGTDAQRGRRRVPITPAASAPLRPALPGAGERAWRKRWRFRWLGPVRRPGRRCGSMRPRR